MKSPRLAVPAVWALLALGCSSMRLISDYDERIDAGTTSFEQKVDLFLLTLKADSGQAQAKYENRAKFYDTLRVDLNLLRVRAEAIPKNTLTTKQIALLLDDVDNLALLHKSFGFIPPSQIATLQSGFDVACGAILKLELAKKRGESGSSSK